MEFRFERQPEPLHHRLSLSIDRDQKVKLRHLIHSEHFTRQVWIALLLITLVLAAFFSRSRAGITGLILGFWVFAGLLAFCGKGLTRGFWIGFGLAVALLGLYGSQMGFDRIIARFLLSDQDTSRLDIWRDGWDILQHHPWGIGPGNYRFVEHVFRTHFTAPHNNVHVHNDYLQIAIEYGWAAAGLMVLGAAWFLVNSLFHLRRKARALESLFFLTTAGAISGVVSILFHSLVDFNLQIPANAMVFVLLLAMIDAAIAQRPQSAPTPPRFGEDYSPLWVSEKAVTCCYGFVIRLSDFSLKPRNTLNTWKEVKI